MMKGKEYVYVDSKKDRNPSLQQEHLRVLIKTLRPVAANEELLIDYGDEYRGVFDTADPG